MNGRSGPRVLCVYQHAPTPGAPGIYRHRLYFAELVRRGFTIDLVSTPLNYMTGEVPASYRGKRSMHESIDGIDHHWVWASRGIHGSIKRRAANYVSFACAAGLRAMTLPRPDVLFISSPPLTVGALGPVLSRRFRVPWVLEIRDIWPESAASVGWLSESSLMYKTLDRVARRIATAADAVIVPTPGLIGDAQRHGAHTVEVVPGVVTDLGLTETERVEARAELGIDEGRCVFLYAGAIGVANGIDVLLDAVATASTGARFEVILAGDGSWRSELERRLAGGGLDRVRYVGAVPKDDVRRLLAASDVCLHVLRSDPIFEAAQPTKMLEYFGARRATITTVPGRPQELAVASGGAFAPGVDALSAELERWSALGEDERLKHGAQAYAFGEAEFGIGPAAEHLEELFVRVARR